jgi:hypothetical protein
MVPSILIVCDSMTHALFDNLVYKKDLCIVGESPKGGAPKRYGCTPITLLDHSELNNFTWMSVVSGSSDECAKTLGMAPNLCRVVVVVVSGVASPALKKLCQNALLIEVHPGYFGIVSAENNTYTLEVLAGGKPTKGATKAPKLAKSLEPTPAPPVP